MQLKSMSRPVTEVAEAAPSREVLKGSRGAAAGELSLSEKHLVVHGKSDVPLQRQRPRLGGLETVIGPDDRTRILDTDQAPWRQICALEIESPFGSFIGTGWFVGPKTLITAGHCVFDQTQMNGWATSITVSPGRSGDTKPFGSLRASRFSSVDRWVQNQDPDYDIGCIHLDQPASDSLGWFSVAVMSNADLEHSLVNISGYPGDRGNGREQYFHANRILRAGPRRIFYDVDTFGGQSGAPVWIYEDGSNVPVVVGIHAYGTGGTPADYGILANSAPRIVPEVLEQIRQWMAENGDGTRD